MIDIIKITFKDTSEKRKAQLQAKFGSFVAGASESGQAYITQFNTLLGKLNDFTNTPTDPEPQSRFLAGPSIPVLKNSFLEYLDQSIRNQKSKSERNRHNQNRGPQIPGYKSCKGCHICRLKKHKKVDYDWPKSNADADEAGDDEDGPPPTIRKEKRKSEGNRQGSAAKKKRKERPPILLLLRDNPREIGEANCTELANDDPTMNVCESLPFEEMAFIDSYACHIAGSRWKNWAFV